MNPDKTALIFIEFQNDFCKEGGKLYPLVESELKRNDTIANAVRLLKNARAGGYRIIHCPFTLDKHWIHEHHCDGLLAGLCDDDVFLPGTWGHEIIDELKPLDDEIVLENKRCLSGFSHTNLDHLLHYSFVQNAVICGLLTNVCVQATAWSAYDAGYQVRIVPRACAATSPELQRYVEEQIVPMIGGAITPDEI